MWNVDLCLRAPSPAGKAHGLVRLALVTALALALAVGASACGGSDGGGVGTNGGPTAVGEPPARPTGTLRVAIGGQPQTLDPTKMIAYDLPITQALYEGLMTRSQEGKLVSALATAWRSNADASEWTLTLRRGVTFSDGAEFTSAAAKKSIEYFQNRESVWGFATGPIVRIETPDDYTLVVSYDKPFPDFASYQPYIKMMSPRLLEGSLAAVKKRLATNAAGTGPYTLDRFSSSAGVVAHANLDYWGEGPYIETLELKPIVEESARYAALQAGDIDVVTSVPPRTAQQFANDPRLTVTTADAWGTNTLSMGTQTKPLDDVRVRQALAWAIDREAIAETVLQGQAKVTGTVMPPGTYGFKRPETQYSYNPEKARALLEEAGLRLPVKLSLVAYSTVTEGSAIAQALAEQAKAGGFDIRVIPLQEAAAVTDLDKVHRRYHIHMIPNGYVNGGPFHIAAGFVTGHASYRGRELLDVIAKINSTANGPERLQLIAEAQELIAQELPELPLFQRSSTDATTKALQNHRVPADGFLPIFNLQYLAAE
jgi:peptide/nickel transport system substrate-binding protein